MKNRRLAATAIGFILIASAASAAEVTGEGKWQSERSKAIGGEWKVQLARTGDTVAGEISLDGSNVFTGGDVQGTLDGSGIALGVMVEGTAQATFKGTVKGTEVSGEWECDAIQDSGTWHGTLTDGNGGVATGE